MMQLANMVGELATGEATDDTESQPDAKAAARGRSRATKVYPRERSAIAKKASNARWKDR